jgi:hypothetical protein
MSPPASAAENRTHDAEKIGLSRYSNFFSRIGQNRTFARTFGVHSLTAISLTGVTSEG